jgi:hypothetical protein
LDSKIEKIVLILNADLGPELDSEWHVICVLIARIKGRKSFITILDALWISSMHAEYNRHYINRLLQLKKAIINIPGWSSTEILLSDACKEWLKTYECTTRDYENQETVFSEQDQSETFEIGQHADYGIDWLSAMLSTQISHKKSDSKALQCPYTAALYVIGCIVEHMPREDTTKYFDAGYIYLISDKLNLEFSTCILSGFCLISTSSIQSGLCGKFASENRFLIIDGDGHLPCATYVWAVKYDSGERISVYALRNDSESDLAYTWNALTHTVRATDNTLDFLYKLRKEDNAIEQPQDEDVQQEERGRKRSVVAIDEYSRNKGRQKIENGPAKSLFVILKVLDKLILQ